MVDYGVIIQARMGSTRRPGKVGYEILSHPMLYHQLKRLIEGGIKNVFVATTILNEDQHVENICNSLGIKSYRGSVNDVMDRLYQAAINFNVKNIIRVGGDDPLIDPECIKKLIKEHQSDSKQLIYSSHFSGWIYGTAGELIETAALEKALHMTTNSEDREHTIPFIKRNSEFSKKKCIPSNIKLNRTDIFLSVDYPEDLDLIKQILEYFNNEDKLYSFTQSELITLYDSGILDIKNKNLHEPFDK